MVAHLKVAALTGDSVDSGRNGASHISSIVRLGAGDTPSSTRERGPVRLSSSVAQSETTKTGNEACEETSAACSHVALCRRGGVVSISIVDVGGRSRDGGELEQRGSYRLDFMLGGDIVLGTGDAPSSAGERGPVRVRDSFALSRRL